MGDFRQDRGRRFGRGNGGGFGGRDRGPVTMHQATCAQCGKPCEVPFRPTDGKPVYCNVCFGGKKEIRNNRGGDRFPQKNFNSYKAPVKIDLGSNINKGNNDEFKRQFEMLNAKLDRIIKVLTPAVPAKEEKKAVIIKKKEATPKKKEKAKKLKKV